MKTKCAKCGGSMKKGGTVKKMAKGGQPLAALTMPGYNANITTMKKGGALKAVPADKVGLAKLPIAVRNKMGYMKKGGVKKK